MLLTNEYGVKIGQHSENEIEMQQFANKSDKLIWNSNFQKSFNKLQLWLCTVHHMIQLLSDFHQMFRELHKITDLDAVFIQLLKYSLQVRA